MQCLYRCDMRGIDHLGTTREAFRPIDRSAIRDVRVLPRFVLDSVQLTSQQFNRVVTELMLDVCLRTLSVQIVSMAHADYSLPITTKRIAKYQTCEESLRSSSILVNAVTL